MAIILSPPSLRTGRAPCLMWKTSGNVFLIFRASRRVNFSYFPKVALHHGGAPQYLLELLWNMLQYSI